MILFYFNPGFLSSMCRLLCSVRLSGHVSAGNHIQGIAYCVPRISRLTENDADNALILGGEASGRVKDMPTVKELIDRIMAQAEEVLTAMPRFDLRI
jgi:hypothetical protein